MDVAQEVNTPVFWEDSFRVAPGYIGIDLLSPSQPAGVSSPNCHAAEEVETGGHGAAKGVET